MFASVTSAALVGVEPCPVRVEVHIGGGTKRFTIVGLPDASVREAKDRVRAAFSASGHDFPSREVIVNLSPADLPKAGSAYDLPIALGVLAAMTDTKTSSIPPVVALGELALDGGLRPVVGGLAAAVVASDLRLRCVLPAGSQGLQALKGPIGIVAARSLNEAIAGAAGQPTGCEIGDDHSAVAPADDLGSVRGQHMARRALELAAAGGHHLLMTGPPGGGKTMLARCLPSLLPPLSDDEVLEVAMAFGAAGLAKSDGDLAPFRAPHHSATLAAIVGGGSGVPVPGEVTLAHRGVLFLDELGEFPVSLLDALRQPVEDGRVVVARKGRAVSFPSRFQLVAASNPCPCGWQGDYLKPCKCSPRAVDRYRARFSGPLLDRFDLRVRVARLEPDELVGPPGESSALVRERVVAARKRQMERGGLNREMSRAMLDDMEWTDGSLAALSRSVRAEAITARGWDRVRRVAVTLADLDETSVVEERHVVEAMRFRGAS